MQVDMPWEISGSLRVPTGEMLASKLAGAGIGMVHFKLLIKI